MKYNKRKKLTSLIIKKRLKHIKNYLVEQGSKHFRILEQPNRLNKHPPFGSTKPKHTKYKWDKSKSEIAEEINELAIVKDNQR